jgi:hypothetical protein
MKAASNPPKTKRCSSRKLVAKGRIHDAILLNLRRTKIYSNSKALPLAASTCVALLNDDDYLALSAKMIIDSSKLKQRYRKLVIRFHPDKNPELDTTSIFRCIQEAYEALSSTMRSTTHMNVRVVGIGRHKGHGGCRHCRQIHCTRHKTANEYLGLIERAENGPPRACANWTGPSSGQ